MPNDGALLDPLLDTREVVETYLGSQQELPDWRSTLGEASARLARLAELYESAEIAQVADEVKRLAESGMKGDAAALNSVSRRVARLLDSIHVAGLPKPKDTDWAF